MQAARSAVARASAWTRPVRPRSTAAPASDSVSAAFVEAAVQHARARGVAVEAIDGAGCVDGQMPVRQFMRLQVGAMAAMKDEMLGFMPRPQSIGTWAMMCRSVIDCATLGHALARMFRFYSILGGHQRMALRVEGRDAVLEWRPPEGAGGIDPFAFCLTMSCTHRFASWLIDEVIPLTAVSFACTPPAWADDLQAAFNVRQVAFGEATCFQLRFSAKHLDAQVRQTARTLVPMVRQPAEELLAAVCDSSSWTAQLERLLVDETAHAVTFEELAQRFDIHPQTLRRRLADEGTTFKQVRDEVRRQSALYYVGQSSMSVDRVAELCGFSEASAFIRAFKRWTGETPMAFAHGRAHAAN